MANVLTLEQIKKIRQGAYDGVHPEPTIDALCDTVVALYAQPFTQALEQGLEKMKEERDLWKSRAQLAEEQHRRLQNATQQSGLVGPIGPTGPGQRCPTCWHSFDKTSSRRDLFAAAALQGMLRPVDLEDAYDRTRLAAAVAVKFADKLIAELDKTPVAAKRRAGLWRGILGSPGHVRDARDTPGDVAASVLPKASYWQWRIAGGRGDGLADGSEDTAEKAQVAADAALVAAGWELE